MKDKLLFITFIVGITVACCINIITLNRQSIRLDESQSLWVAPKTIPGIIQTIAADVHLPLYHIILHFWIMLWGNNIYSARMLSFLFFLITIPVLYILAKESSNKNVAMLTVTLFVFSPFVMWYSNETRMYSLFTLTTTANHLFFLRLLRSSGKKGLLGYTLSGISGIYSHYFFNLILLIQAVIIAIRLYNLSKEKHTTIKKIVIEQKKLVLSFIATSSIFFTVLAPWLYFVAQNGGAANSQPLITAPSSYNLAQAFVNFIFGFQSQPIQAVIISLWPITTLLLFLLFTRGQQIEARSMGYFICITLIPVVITFFASYIRPIFLSRYLIMVTPSLFLVLAVSLMSLSKKISRICIPTLILLLIGLSIYQNISAQTPVREDYGKVAQYLQLHATERDIIAVSAPFTVYPIEYSYNGKARIITIPEWNRYEAGAIPQFTSDNLKKQVNLLKSQYEVVYLVLSYNQGYEREIEQYMDAHFHRIGKKEFSPGLQIRIYQFKYD